MKPYIIGIIVLVAFAGVADYFFGFHTYFQRTEVNEAVPSMVGSTPTPQAGTASQQSPTPSVSPRTVVQGSFAEVDFIHKGSGTAKIIEDSGRRYLRFEDFEVTNGPDLYVYLSESKTPGGDLKSLDKYISLGRLKGNIGNQNYEIPEPFRGYDTAVIWCQKFGVLFSYAVME